MQAVLTVLLTARFILSFFPRLERLRKREQPWIAIAQATDPVLQPIRSFIKHVRPSPLVYTDISLSFTHLIFLGISYMYRRTGNY